MIQKSELKFYSLGDSAILVQWNNADAISKPISYQVNQLCKAIKNLPFPGLVDMIPAFTSLTIVYDVLLVNKESNNTVFEYVSFYVNALWEALIFIEDNDEKNILTIPVCYDETLGNDLTAISEILNLSSTDVINLHCKEEYYCYMLGFLPGFAYLGVLNQKLKISRKSKPVLTKAGAVGIAGLQTGIYPAQSPGGWYILGYTPLQIFNINRKNPALIQAGNYIRFQAIEPNEYFEIINAEKSYGFIN